LPLALRQPRHRYEAAQLKQVIAQIRFSPMLRFELPEFRGAIADFQARVGRYPRSSQEQQLSVVITPAGPVQGTGAPVWRFTDGDGAWSVVLGRDVAGLETARYTVFEDCLERFVDLVGAVRELGVQHRERLGLRYVNEFRHPEARDPIAWREFLAEELLGMVGGELLAGANVEQAIEEIRLRESAGSLVIRHGYVGSPATDDPFYLLDIDYFNEGGRMLDPNSIGDELWALHDEIQGVFEVSLKPKMRGHLGDLGPINA